MMATSETINDPQVSPERQDGFVPGARANMRNRVILAAVLLGLVIFGLPVFISVVMVKQMAEPRTFGQIELAFNDGDRPTALMVEQHINLMNPADETNRTAAILLRQSDAARDEMESQPLFDDRNQEGPTPHDIDAIFEVGGQRYVAISEQILALDGKLETPVTFDGFVLAVCSDAELVWLLIKGKAGLAISRFDGLRLSTPVLIDKPSPKRVRMQSRHHAALMPLSDGWLVVSGTDSSAKYKYLPMAATESWISIPWKSLALKTSTWEAFTYFGRPRLIVMDLSQMLNPFKAVMMLLGRGSLSGDIYEFKNRTWTPERTLDIPGLGKFAGVSDRRALPAVLYFSSFFGNQDWNAFQLDLNDSSTLPWKPVPRKLGSPVEMVTLIKMILWGLFSAFCILIGVIFMLDRAMRRYRTMRLLTPEGNGVEHASLVRRGMARLVDLLIVMVPGYGGMLLILPIWDHGVKLDEIGTMIRIGMAVAFSVVFVYLVPLIFWSVLEWRTGQTPGKWLLEIKVVDVSSFQKPSFKAAFIRNLLLIVEAISYGLVALLMIPISRFQQRLGDIGAKTIVIRDIRNQ